MQNVFYESSIGKWTVKKQINGEVIRRRFNTEAEANACLFNLNQFCGLSGSSVPVSSVITTNNTKTVVYDAPASTVAPTLVKTPKNIARKNEVRHIKYHGHYHFVTEYLPDMKTVKEEYHYKTNDETARIIHQDTATIVIFEDGSKGVAVCGKNDTFSRKTGMKIAYNRAMIAKLQKEIEQLSKGGK